MNLLKPGGRKVTSYTRLEPETILPSAFKRRSPRTVTLAYRSYPMPGTQAAGAR